MSTDGLPVKKEEGGVGESGAMREKAARFVQRYGVLCGARIVAGVFSVRRW
jgi:hypothetical protein